MILACHTLIYSDDADATRAFFRDVLDFPSVDAGTGDDNWLIFRTGPSELGVHPTGPLHDAATTSPHHAVSFIVDDIESTMDDCGPGALSSALARTTTATAWWPWSRCPAPVTCSSTNRGTRRRTGSDSKRNHALSRRRLRRRRPACRSTTVVFGVLRRAPERPGRQAAAYTASLTSRAAPMTPASPPSSLSTTGRFPVASGSDCR